MTKRKRLTRDCWLVKAIDVLTKKGSAELRVNSLASALGVTKGSFYWHFKDRNDFAVRLLDYWQQTFTTNVIEKINATPGGPEERLLALMQLLSDSGAARFDVAVRAWTAQERKLDALVQKVDRQRLIFVRALFSEMGFHGAELDMRAQTFLAYHSFEVSLLSHLEQTKEERQKLLNLRHDFFVRP